MPAASSAIPIPNNGREGGDDAGSVSSITRSWANSVSRSQQFAANFGSQPKAAGSAFPISQNEIPETPRFDLPTLDERTPLIDNHRPLQPSTASSLQPQQFEQDLYHGKSNMAQTVFNSVNMLMGIAILSLPLAFKYCGWILGISIFVFCLILTNYTAKTLAKCMNLDPSSRFYVDVAEFAFGKKARGVVAIFFLLDLLTATQTLYPNVDLTMLKIISFVLITPATWMPVHMLSYTSLLGIISASSLVSVVIYDGLSKPTAPGSLIEPMETTLFPTTWMAVPLTFGLINAGFTGHAVLPSIYRDMKKPQSVEASVNISYLIVGVIYLTLAIGGYLMFGNQTMEEITQNIMSTPGYNVLVNSFVVWLIVINPFSKYPLGLQPINEALEISVSRVSYMHYFFSPQKRRYISRMVLRTLLSGFIVTTAIVFPDFDRALSLLGSCFSFMISGIFPLMAHMKLFGWQMSRNEFIWNVFLLVISSIMALLGTIWTFFPSEWFGENSIINSKY
ncbi:1109_t:CDS:2 [Ambispora gerdemannii]|uniref:1109_t:CDS:1 n=1 Tax=Ambispora gerdemannii TaxID=144530 RepID=A0A9N8ZL95_9GLOM|nr:1109_t:CDS:2 [Ambispora gerdemannii]